MEKSLLKKMAEISAHNLMILVLLVTVITLSIGLAFYFLVTGNVGFGIGIAMFVVASLVFIVGMAIYFAKREKIQSAQ